jgi:glycosyltransferase involved in cell wall biosynthesis
MRLAVFVAKYSLKNDRYLTDILSKEFKKHFSEIDVYLFDWYNYADQDFYEQDGIKIFVSNHRISLAHKYNIFKWTFNPIFAFLRFYRLLKSKKYDLSIALVPSIGILPLISTIRKISNKLYLIYWDFYPFYQEKLGLIRSKLLIRVFAFLENFVMNKFDHIGLMTEKNIYFYKKYYTARNPQLQVLPIWGENHVLPPLDLETIRLTREKYQLQGSDCLALFGGQIMHGRGVEEIMEVAAQCLTVVPSLKILFVGHGNMVEYVKRKNPGNVLHIATLGKDDYNQLLQSSDIGLVYTKEIGEISSFPSKSIDYIRVGLPICAAVENDSDYKEIIENKLGVGLSCSPRDIESFKNNLLKLVQDVTLREQMRHNAAKIYQKEFSVAEITTRILRQVK